MDKLAIGLWGCFYGGSLLVLCGAVFAWSRSMRRIGLNASLSALGPAFVVTVFLGGLPITERGDLLRLLAYLTTLVGALLVYQLLNVLGEMESLPSRRRAKTVLFLVGTGITSMGWLYSPVNAMLICASVALVMAIYGLGLSIQKALHGYRLVGLAMLAVLAVAACYTGLSVGILYPEKWSRSLQIASASAAVVYVLALAAINSLRYAYLLERKKIMEYGPAYDPITRLRSRSETGQMARDIFDKLPHNTQPLGVIVLTVANLYTLEQLHGTAAMNSALFLLAGRVKRALPLRTEIGRLGFDGFLLIMRNCTDSGRLVDLAHDLNRRLHKSAILQTNPAARQLESAHTVWTAQIGIGVLHVKNLETSSFDAITMGRNMSRTAISYASKVAWFDHASGEITELPAYPGMV